LAGHRAGLENARAVIRYLNKLQVKCATLYAFSTENWNRPDDEVSGLMELLGDIIEDETRELHENNVRMVHVGQLDGLAEELQRSIRQATTLTEKNTGMTVGLAFNYGGRLEIIDAVRRLMAAGVPPQSLDEKLFGEYLYTAGLPEVDLVVRTGGELRLSNFLVWQSVYSELYFTPVLWPDFNEAEVDKALEAYSRRDRRFGGLAGRDPDQAIP
jgi:undecaprenyl diphosphate synthase